jgi:hypothetical protein
VWNLQSANLVFSTFRQITAEKLCIVERKALLMQWSRISKTEIGVKGNGDLATQ